MKCRQTPTRPGSIPYSFFPNFSPNSKHTETTAWQIAVLTVGHTSTTPQPNAALSTPPATSTTHDLYIENLEQSFVAAREYFAKECTPTLDKPNPADLLRTELDAQCKQFDLIMKQNSPLLAAMAKGNGGGGGGGSGGSGGSGSGGSGTHKTINDVDNILCFPTSVDSIIDLLLINCIGDI
jgi:hypothetical protein